MLSLLTKILSAVFLIANAFSPSSYYTFLDDIFISKKLKERKKTEQLIRSNHTKFRVCVFYFSITHGDMKCKRTKGIEEQKKTG